MLKSTYKLRRSSCFILFLLLVISISGARADNSKTKPRVGLVLAGGGALGFAHVGVLKVLEQSQVPIHAITGTSMGAIVGAAYAAGVPLQEMEQLLSETDWDALFDEEPPRAGIPYRYKPGRNREILGDTKFSFKDGGLVLPAGVVGGQHVRPLLQKLYGRVPNPISFDNLPIPFRAVVADIETGKPIVPDGGDLASVVRASMSVPGFFAPVEIGDSLFVDGGIANNLPIDIALKMGVDTLIVVELNADLKKRDELTSPLSIAGQIVSLLLAQNSTLQKNLLRPRDILIEPDLTGYSSTDFAKAKDLMALGETKARTVVTALESLSVTLSEYDRFQATRGKTIADDRLIDVVRIENDSNVPEEEIRSALVSKPGMQLDRSVIENDVRLLYNRGTFSSVQYRIIDTDTERALVFETKRKPWLDRYARFGVAFEDDFEGESDFRFAFAYRLNDINDVGGQVDLEGEVGKSHRLFTELYQPFSKGSPYFVAPAFEVNQTNISLREDSDVIARYERTTGAGSLRAGRALGTGGEVFLGVRRGFGELERDIGEQSLPNFSYDIGEVYTRVVYDTLDTVDFPTTGLNGQINYRAALEEIGATSEFHDLIGNFTLPLTRNRDTVTMNTEFGVTFDERPIERYFSLGGFADISGYAPNTLIAADYFVGRLLYHHRFAELKTPIFGFNFFAGHAILPCLRKCYSLDRQRLRFR